MSELDYTLCEEKKDCAEGVKLNQEVIVKEKRVLGPEAHYTLVKMDNLAILLAEDARPAIDAATRHIDAEAIAEAVGRPKMR